MARKAEGKVKIKGDKLRIEILKTEYSIAEVSDICGRGHGCCWDWIRKGEIEPGTLTKICKLIKVDQSEFLIEEPKEDIKGIDLKSLSAQQLSDLANKIVFEIKRRADAQVKEIQYVQAEMKL